ncbi:MAG: SOS response-associated peptidase family protein, partial [Thiobacillaceae bacterium]
MCGRYALTSPPEVIAQRFNLLWVPELVAHYNIAPSQLIPVIRETAQGRELAPLKSCFTAVRHGCRFAHAPV